MATIKKAQGGGLLRKGIKAVTEAIPKPKVSKWDYPTKESRDIQRSLMEAYPEKIKKMPTGTNKIDKVKKVKPKYDKNGLEILKDKTGGIVKKKMRTGGSIPKAQLGRLIRSGAKKYGKRYGSAYEYKAEKFRQAANRWDPSSGTPPPKRPLKEEVFTYGKDGRNQYGAYNAKYDGKGGVLKIKMRNGGSLSGLTASTKRVGPVDPKGAFTKVQKKALAGSKGKAKLTKDKQLGATKMAKRGMSIKKK
jgi:hypothetical protein